MRSLVADHIAELDVSPQRLEPWSTAKRLGGPCAAVAASLSDRPAFESLAVEGRVFVPRSGRAPATRAVVAGVARAAGKQRHNSNGHEV